MHPAYVITPDQRTEINALMGRINSALWNAPAGAIGLSRLKTVRRYLVSATRRNSRVYMDHFLADWRAGIKLACSTVEWAARNADDRRAA